MKIKCTYTVNMVERNFYLDVNWNATDEEIDEQIKEELANRTCLEWEEVRGETED